MNPSNRIAANAKTAELTFGVEIETYGLGDDLVIAAVHSVIGGMAGTNRRGQGICTAPDGRVWTAMHDGSIQGGRGSEMVTPILKGDADLEILQQVVRAIRAAGGKSDAARGCGVHVHVGTQTLDVATIGRVVKTATKLDGFIRKAAAVSESRARWCAPLAANKVSALGRCRDASALARAWYGERSDYACQMRAGSHYDSSRYHGVNLHSVFYANRGTVEFRYFDGTLHAGKIKSYVQLCLAIVAKAAVTSAASAAAVMPQNATAALHLLQGLGMYGEKFETARLHLLAPWRSEGSRMVDREVA